MVLDTIIRVVRPEAWRRMIYYHLPIYTIIGHQTGHSDCGVVVPTIRSYGSKPPRTQAKSAASRAKQSAPPKILLPSEIWCFTSVKGAWASGNHQAFKTPLVFGQAWLAKDVFGDTKATVWSLLCIPNHIRERSEPYIQQWLTRTGALPLEIHIREALKPFNIRDQTSNFTSKIRTFAHRFCNSKTCSHYWVSDIWHTMITFEKFEVVFGYLQLK